MTLSSREHPNFYLGKEVADKEDMVDMVDKNFEVEQSSDMVDLVAGIEEEENNETSLHLTAMAGTAGFLLF